MLELKYGCNPHQQPAQLSMPEGVDFPVTTVNGNPGYINWLDALNAWQLVRELDDALGLPAAASFKHVSPAGAAVAVPLSEALQDVYQVPGDLSPLATAYARARGADPLSSFGDFIALSRPVDESTAKLIKPLVSDGVIAPGYSPEALALLKGKKGGNYVVLEASLDYQAPEMEYREVYGITFSQKRNALCLSQDNLLHDIVTHSQHLPEEAIRDLILASITLKYTQSNSVGYAVQGQMVGIGAGQQSRIDCTKLAGRKTDIWFLRQHPKVRELPFHEGTKRVDRTNASIRYIEDDMTSSEYDLWQQSFTNTPSPLTAEEKTEWLGRLNGVSLASDAFFPFRDNLDQASKRGVQYVVQAGGSVRDDVVIEAANHYGMVMAFSKIRLFHH